MLPPEPTNLIKILEETLTKNNIDFKMIMDEFGQVKAVQDRKNGKVFTFNDHIRGLIYALLSNQRKWGQIAKNIKSIEEIFFHFDAEKILTSEPEYFIYKLKEIRCGNRKINNQMADLAVNIETMKMIAKEYGSLDNFVTSDDPINIAITLGYPGLKKIKQIGLALALEYLKNLGIDACKPDLHIKKIISHERLNYYSGILSDEEISQIVIDLAYGAHVSAVYLDNLLWLLCAEDYGNICRKVPRCDLCGFKNSCNYPKNSVLPFSFRNIYADSSK